MYGWSDVCFHWTYLFLPRELKFLPHRNKYTWGNTSRSVKVDLVEKLHWSQMSPFFILFFFVAFLFISTNNFIVLIHVKNTLITRKEGFTMLFWQNFPNSKFMWWTCTLNWKHWLCIILASYHLWQPENKKPKSII